ncbi:MAG: DNA-deoxyinosine glycosylase [Sphaerochaetaceae bacterium]|jgi:TDG/mug DNA glycosylase family protein|nr:DNA-deoxyinosine glycosylase [Sphaerochaetaceae bacterium]
MERLIAFPPIETPLSRVLILGSMPSVVSLRKQEYYGHPTNAFWPIMERMCGYPLGSYEEKRRMIKESRLALWDVLGSCKREGSSDQGIREGEVNDLPAFLSDHPLVTCIICNGTVAMRLCERHVLRLHPVDIDVFSCPSTSAANTMPFEQKVSIWTNALHVALDLS